LALRGLNGNVVPPENLLALGKPVLLVFSDPDCGPCRALLPDLARWERDHAESLTLALVSRGTPDANHAKLKTGELSHVLLQKGSEIADAYGVNGTPTAVMVRRDGTVGSQAAPGADAIRALVQQSATAAALSREGASTDGHRNGRSHPAHIVSPTVGDAAPSLRLPDLQGRSIDLSDLGGRETVLLFWNPGCGFCQRMLPDLKAWESQSEAPMLLVISTGTAEANNAMGLQSTVVPDPDFTAGRAFGPSGTPSAIVIDDEGRIASALAAGAPSILDLARTGRQRAHAL